MTYHSGKIRVLFSSPCFLLLFLQSITVWLVKLIPSNSITKATIKCFQNREEIEALTRRYLKLPTYF